MKKMWGGRFSEEPDPGALRFTASISFDARLWREDLRASDAWAGALARAAVITSDEARAIRSGLQSVGAELESGSFSFAPDDEDIHTAVERRLTELIGPVAGKLHTGRSRNDQVATDMRLWVMEAESRIIAQLARLQRSIVDRADEHAGTIMPGYTHLQRAQPITFGHWLMACFWALERDRGRLLDIRERASVMPLGSGAIAGTPYAIDRKALAEQLGFKRFSENSIDAVSDRDFVVELLFTAALFGTHLSRLSESIVLFSTAEFGFVTLSDAYATGSSLMPQKKNPDVFELARGKAGTLIGHLTGLLSTLKGLPSAYDKDLQEDKQPVFAACDALDAMLPVIAGAISTMSVNAGKMAGALDTSMLATEQADQLVSNGLSFRDAHAAVGEALKQGASDGSVADIASFEAAIARRDATGGTSVRSVKEQIAAARLILADDGDPKHE